MNCIVHGVTKNQTELSNFHSTNEECIWAVSELLYINHHGLLSENKTNGCNGPVDVFPSSSLTALGAVKNTGTLLSNLIMIRLNSQYVCACVCVCVCVCVYTWFFVDSSSQGYGFSSGHVWM